MDVAGRSETTDGKPILSVESVSRSFGAVTVLEDISLEIERGSVTAIIGPNGSGKTTLSRIIAGLSQPNSGHVTFRTTDERPIGYLPQEPQFRPMFTVEETLSFYAELLATPTSPENAMDQVGLLDVRGRRVDALSGGMRRLLGLAIGIIGHPPVVLLDEPTSGLDPRMTTHLFSVAETLSEQGIAVMITTHDLSHAENTDKLVMMHQGRAITQGTPNDVLSQTNSDSLSDAFVSMVGVKPTVQAGIPDNS